MKNKKTTSLPAPSRGARNAARKPSPCASAKEKNAKPAASRTAQARTAAPGTAQKPLRESGARHRDVTERTRLEEALRESEERYRILFESAGDAIFILEAEGEQAGRIVAANAAAASMHGYSTGELTGLDIRDLDAPEAAREASELIRRILQGEWIKKEIRHRRRDGSLFPVEISAGLLDLRDRKYIIAFDRDITERKQAEEEIRRAKEGLELRVRERTAELKEAYDALRETKERLFRILESISDAFFTVDREWRITYANSEAIRLWRKSREELLGRSIWEMSPKSKGTIFEQQYRKALQEQVPVVFEALSPLLDLWVEVRAYPAQDGLSVYFHDITERRRADSERARLAAAVTSTAEAVVITDARGTIQYVNPAFERITGYARDEAVGADLHMLDSGRHDETFYRRLRETIAREGVWTGRLVHKKKDGTFYEEECTYSPVKGPSGEIVNYVSIKRDVTERLRLESIAEAVNTMDNIGYVFSGVRHEIGNPLNSIKMILGILQSKLDSLSREAIREYLDRVMAQVSRVEYLLQSLKSFNLYEGQELQNVRVSSFLEKFLPLVREDFSKKDIAIDVAVAPDAEWVSADPRALQQVLLNVLTNVSDALAGRPDPKVALNVSRTTGMIRIRIEDNGSGMTAEEQKGLFKPFYTTKARGTGLGLVIVKKMLTMMNGTITITSRKDVGTVVNIALPEGKHERQ